jgi:hypothetical protein
MDKGKKILLKTYWCSKGWCFREPTEEEFLLAKEQGYMFDFCDWPSHSDSMKLLRGLLSQITPQDVANAFLYSLSTRALDYRSAFGSYWYGRAIPDHLPEHKESCCCGWCASDRVSKFILSERNILNFERHKWGGVLHGNLTYILLDLEQFIKLPKKQPTEQDIQIFRDILSAIKELNPEKKAGAYRELLLKKKLFPTNKNEISTLLDLFGICGILSTDEHPCPRFAYYGSRGLPPQEHTNDFRYPVSYWRASDGVNEERFFEVFGFHYHEL